MPQLNQTEDFDSGQPVFWNIWEGQTMILIYNASRIISNSFGMGVVTKL